MWSFRFLYPKFLVFHGSRCFNHAPTYVEIRHQWKLMEPRLQTSPINENTKTLNIFIILLEVQTLLLVTFSYCFRK